MKRLAIKLHLWLGLTVGLLWAVQGLTGAALVFHRELDRLAHPEWAGTPGPMAPLDALIAAAQVRTGAMPVRVSIIDTRPDVVVVDYENATGEARQLFFDAATARLLGERAYDPARPGNGATSRFLYVVHERLTAGETGAIVIGLSGILLFASVGLGLWIGWPRAWQGVARVRAWRWRLQKLYGWHRLVGLTAGLCLLIVVPGGVYMIFSGPIRAAVAAVVPHRMPYKAVPIAKMPVRWVSPQTALDTARARFPQAAFVRAGLPSAEAPVYAIRLRQPDEVRAWSGTTTVTVDGATGRVLEAYDPLTAPLSNRIADAAFSAHNGEIAGIVGRVLVMLAGLSLPALYVTGAWLWLAKRGRRVLRALPAE